MEPISPRTGAPEAGVAENQKEYVPYPAAIYEIEGRQTIVSRWRLSDEEREAVARGEDLYLGLITDGNPVQPLFLSIGPSFWADLDFICPICKARYKTTAEVLAHAERDHTKAELEKAGEEARAHL